MALLSHRGQISGQYFNKNLNIHSILMLDPLLNTIQPDRMKRRLLERLELSWVEVNRSQIVLILCAVFIEVCV